jgi:hypothetical protein
MFTEIIVVSIVIILIVFVIHIVSSIFRKPSQDIEKNLSYNQNRKTILSSIWFWWVLTTIIYLIFNLSHYPGNTPSLLGHIAGFVGLFVPYGMLSSILFLSPFSWISAVVFLFLMFRAEKELNAKNYNLSKRILINLLILLLLTIAVDAMRGTFFQSWVIFFKGAFG